MRRGAVVTVALCVALLAFCVEANASIYWGHSLVIGRANNDGSEALTKTVGFIGTTYGPRVVGNACGVAVDDRYIYWADSAWNTIGRATLDGFTELNPNFITGADEPCGVTLDDSHIYWTNRGGGSIGRALLDGSGVDQSFVDSLTEPCGVAVDDRFVYWAGSGLTVVGRALLAGGTVGPPLVPGDGSEGYCGLVRSGPDLLWGSYGDSIGRVGTNGSDPDPTFLDGLDRPCGLAVHDSRIYWSEQSLPYGRISRAQLNGSGQERGVVDGISRLECGGIGVDSLGPAPSAPPPSVSDFRIAEIKRNKRRAVLYVAVDLVGDGQFKAWLPGMRVTVLPERIRQGGYLAAGRKWLKIAPMRRRESGSRCILRALRRGWVVKRQLKIHFGEPGKTLQMKSKKLRFFRVKRNRKPKRPRRATGCYAGLK